MWRYETVPAINASMPTHPMVVRRIQRSARPGRTTNEKVSRQHARIGKWFNSLLGHFLTHAGASGLATCVPDPGPSEPDPVFAAVSGPGASMSVGVGDHAPHPLDPGVLVDKLDQVLV